MKQSSSDKSRSNRRPNSKARTLDARRLASVRGGDLGITVELVDPPPDYMSQQHNELLLRL